MKNKPDPKPKDKKSQTRDTRPLTIEELTRILTQKYSKK